VYVSIVAVHEMERVSPEWGVARCKLSLRPPFKPPRPRPHNNHARPSRVLVTTGAQ
jgi:hypothetical protein